MGERVAEFFILFYFFEKRVDEFSVKCFFIGEKIIVLIIVWIEIRVVVKFTFFFKKKIKIIEVFEF